MTGRQPSGPRMRSGLTLIELLVAIVVLGSLEVLLLAIQSPASAPPTTLMIAAPLSPVLVPSPSEGELSLQTTLDRLGFTVNVPRHYHGCRVWNRGSGRVSTRSDAVEAGWFGANGLAQFIELSRQSALGNVTAFAAETAAGEKIELLPSIDQAAGEPFPRAGRGSAEMGRTTACKLEGAFRFSIDFPTNYYSQGPLFSTAENNPDGSSQLLALPARRGGAWIDEGGDLGHWEGGANDNAYLLCWEDMVHGDNDFQDLVIYGTGIRPVQY